MTTVRSRLSAWHDLGGVSGGHGSGGNCETSSNIRPKKICLSLRGSIVVICLSSLVQAALGLSTRASPSNLRRTNSPWAKLSIMRPPLWAVTSRQDAFVYHGQSPFVALTFPCVTDVPAPIFEPGLDGDRKHACLPLSHLRCADLGKCG